LGAKVGKFDSRMEQVRDALLSARKRAVRSALYHFMRQHHDELTTLFAEMPPAWEPLAERFGAMGLTDRRGKPPTANTARMTWWRVRTDVKNARARQVAVNPDEIDRGVRAIPAPPAALAPPAVERDSPAERAMDEALEPEFQIARLPTLIAHPPSTPGPVRPLPAQQGRDPDVEIARLLARPKLGSIPMPAVPDPEDE
jgi:hypothetical protein